MKEDGQMWLLLSKNQSIPAIAVNTAAPEIFWRNWPGAFAGMRCAGPGLLCGIKT
jgi:hypothetical protein